MSPMVNRRNVLIGLGGLVAGGGALAATGAFTTVEAERTVTVETAGDADAFLALTPANDVVSETDGTIEINLDGTGADASGINQNARTRFEHLVDVTNQGTQTIEFLGFEFSVSGADQDDGDVESALKITSGSATIDADGTTNLLEESSEGDAGNDQLGSGEEVPFGIEVDLLDSAVDDISGEPDITLTITAETSS